MNNLELLRAILEGVLVNVIVLIISDLYIKLLTKTKPFDISGYWIGIACEQYKNKTYKGLDIYKIKFIGSNKVSVKIYQLTDNKYRKYVGIGYFRADRLMISYEEKNNSNSRMVGNLALRFYEEKEHITGLAGKYIEFRGKRRKPVSVNYTIKPVHASWKQKIYMTLATEKWIRKDGKKYE